MSKKFETVIFDTETTGLLVPEANDLSEQPEIIELYCVKVDPEFNILGEFEHLLKPRKPLSKKITQITGITDKDLENKPSFADIFNDFAEFMTGVDRLVAHNLPFDRSMVANELLRIDKILNFPWPREHICTVECSMGIEQRRINLTNLHQYATGKPLENAHRAKDDVFGLVRGYNYLLEKGMVPAPKI